MVHGKTTILNELEKRGMEKAINYTTRPRRESEQLNAEYQFITKQEFENMWEEGKLLERAEFNGEYYGISIDSLKDNVACIQITETIKDIKNRAKEFNKNANILVFYIVVEEQERIRRMQKRGDTLESIQKKIGIDREKFINAKNVANYIIENRDIQEAVEKILSKIC